MLETTGVTLAPDPAHQYFFRYQPSAFTDDDITLEFSPQGFLRRICTIIDDQTDEFINQVAELGTNLASTLSGVATRSLERQVLFEGKVDPFDEKAMGQLNAYLKQLNPSLALGARMLGPGENAPASSSASSERSGVFYKPPGTCELTLTSKSGEVSAEARIPHPYQLGFIAIPQAAWVKTHFTMTFDEAGAPAKIEVKKPSTALAVAEVPLNILKAIVSIPAQLIQLRVNLQSDRREALRSQLESDKQMKALEAELDAYRAERKAQTRSLNGNGGSTEATRSGQAETGQGALDLGQVTDLQQQMKKMEQDLLILRRRLNQGG